MEYVIGVDEAGRGPLAGPVAVGVVRAPKDYDFQSVFVGLNDSKKLSEKKREALFQLLLEETKKGALSYCVKRVDALLIDKYGISRAVRRSVTSGIYKLAPTPEGITVYLDGLLHAPKEYTQETVEGGDALIPAIMLASVAAKVSRDRLMKKLSLEYPEYGFEKHKGYGTKAHISAIQEYGFSPLHRRTFCKNIRFS